MKVPGIVFVVAAFFLVSCSGVGIETSTTSTSNSEGTSTNSKTNLEPKAPAPSEVDASKNGVAARQVTPSNSTAIHSGTAAPEDSTFTIELGESGVETRTFHRNTYIKKVVKTVSVDGSTIDLYLTDGRVVKFAGEKVPDLKNALSTDILKAAGEGTDPSSSVPQSGKSGKKNKSVN